MFTHTHLHTQQKVKTKFLKSVNGNLEDGAFTNNMILTHTCLGLIGK